MFVRLQKARTSGPGTKPGWDLNNIPLDRLILHELRQVSSGSWQPVILYDAP